MCLVPDLSLLPELHPLVVLPWEFLLGVTVRSGFFHDDVDDYETQLHVLCFSVQPTDMSVFFLEPVGRFTERRDLVPPSVCEARCSDHLCIRGFAQVSVLFHVLPFMFTPPV